MDLRPHRRRPISVLCVCTLLAGAVACEPADRRPGIGALSGVETPLPDSWSFTSEHAEVLLETRPWYGVRHSVTVVVATIGDRLYVPSIYEEPLPFPGSKFWNRNVAADPRVRLRVDERLYDLEAAPVTDPDEFDRAFRALAAKYPFWKQGYDDPELRPPFVIIRLSAQAATEGQ